MRKVAFRVIIAIEVNSNSSEEKMPIIWNHPVFFSSTVCFYTSARPRERISPLIIIMGRLFKTPKTGSFAMKRNFQQWVYVLQQSSGKLSVFQG